MDDLISRHAAINALHGIAHRFEEPEDWCILEGEAEFVVSKLPSAEPEYTIEMQESDIDEAMRLLRDARVTILPSAQPERIKGKWQWLASTYDRTPCEMRFRCSACHHETITHGSDPWEKFCPNCGADMREATP